jgi:hypothetical protein
MCCDSMFDQIHILTNIKWYQQSEKHHLLGCAAADEICIDKLMRWTFVANLAFLCRYTYVHLNGTQRYLLTMKRGGAHEDSHFAVTEHSRLAGSIG